MIKVKIRGVQVTSWTTIYPPNGLHYKKRSVFYMKDINEITIDTDKGNFIIGKQELASMIRKYARWRFGKEKKKIALSASNV